MKKEIKGIFGLILAISLLFCNLTNANAASSATISVSSGTSKTVIGNSFSVTIKLSSSYALGTWEWTVDYDKNRFKLSSGEANVVGYGDGSKKSVSYTYKFKTIGTGSGKISVKSYSALKYSDKSEFNVSVLSKTVSVITQADLEASYSKNNNLSSLSVNDYDLTPEFDKNTTEYRVEAEANTEKINIYAKKDDSSASINGDGEFEVSEGENKFEIVVTAENGSTKKYTIVVNVIDNNPIEINIDNEKYNVVKRESNLTPPENYEPKTIKINDIDIPAYYNEINNYTLVGLKNNTGDISLFIYDETNNSYIKYNEIKLNQLKIQPLEINKEFDKNYKKTTITINDIKYPALKISNSSFAIIHAKNLDTGKDDYYMYDSNNNAVILYNDDEAKIYIKENKKYLKIILLLGSETIIIFITLIGILIKKATNNRKKKKIIEEKLKKEKIKDDKIIEETHIENETIEEESNDMNNSVDENNEKNNNSEDKKNITKVANKTKKNAKKKNEKKKDKQKEV